MERERELDNKTKCKTSTIIFRFFPSLQSYIGASIVFLSKTRPHDDERDEVSLCSSSSSRVPRRRRLLRISATAASTRAARSEACCSFRQALRTFDLSAAAAARAGDSVPGMVAASSHAASSVWFFFFQKKTSFFGVTKKKLSSLSFSASISPPSPSSLPRISPSRASRALDWEEETSANAASRVARDAVVGWF